MVKVIIGDVEKELGNTDESWINQQINRRRADGQSVCVRVIVEEGDMNMMLSTPTCKPSGGRSRPPRPNERIIFDLWSQAGLDKYDYTGGNLTGFLKQLKRIV